MPFNLEQYMRDLGFVRVRSRISSCHEGWGKDAGYNAWAVYWDNGCWTYPPAKELEVLDDLPIIQEVRR